MYGHAPAPPGITARPERDDATVLDGKATLRQVEIAIDGLPEDAPRIHLALFVPKSAAGRVPVFLGINRCGNHAVAPTPELVLDEDAWCPGDCPPSEDTRGAETAFWCVENLIDRGYAFATFHDSDMDPDVNDFSDGIHPYYPDLPGPKETHWGTIRAWAWGLHRCVDYLVTDEDIDPKGIAVTGHSRRGKTTLLAGALDERIALVVPLQSGTGGCALSRDNDQETVERINTVFPHWFNDVFPQFNGREAKLPFDQHLLMALVAPRPLLDIGGLQDTWANYESAYRAMKAADPVFKFLGAEGMRGTGLIQGEEPMAGDNLGSLLQYRRDTKHMIDIHYWNAILDFADHNLKPSE